MSTDQNVQVFKHGRIFTCEKVIDLEDAEQGKIPEHMFAEAIVVQDGKIAAIGKEEEVERVIKEFGVEVKTTHLNGKLVLPGFIDGHAHITMLGSSLDRIDLIDCQSLLDVQNKLRESYESMDKSVKPKRILCKNWKQTSTGQGVLATDIDQVIADIPVYIEASSLHASWLNSAALKELQITDSTPNPEGGEIFRCPKTNKPAGIMNEMAHFKIVWPGWATLKTEEEGEAEVLRAFNEYSRHGYTGTTDMAMDQHMYNNIRRVQQRRCNGILPLRVSAYWYIFPDSDLEKCFEQIRFAAKLKEENDEWIRIVGIKVMVDGIIDVCTAALKQPYFDGSQCEPIWPLENLQKVVNLADQLGLQIAMHAIGDEAVHVAIEAIAGLPGDPVKVDRRARIEHLELTDPNDVARLAGLGITASIQPIHQDPAFLDGYMAKLNNDHRCARMFAYRDFAEKGAHLTFGTDTPTAEHSALLNLYSAIIRKSVYDPSRKDAFHPEWALPLATSLTAATIGAAFSVKNESRYGSLVVGKSADFTCLDVDPFHLSMEKGYGLLTGSVCATYLAGKEVYSSTSGVSEQQIEKVV